MFGVSAFLYHQFGLAPTGIDKLALLDVHDWRLATHYSLRVMTLIKTEGLAAPIGHSGFVTTLESLFGPAFLGLFALALRQRLKR